MRLRVLLAASLALFSARQASAQEFDNAAVLKLTKAGLAPSVLLAKIAGLPCAYDVSTNGIIALKAAGVADRVIAAMVDRCSGAAKAQGGTGAASDPAAKRASGLYVDLGSESAHNLVRIRPTVATGVRESGNGSLLFPWRLKLGIPRTSAQTAASTSRPTFYFYFEADDPKVGDFGSAAAFAAQSPAEFSLVRFSGKDGQRELIVAKQKGLGRSLGIDPREAIQFSMEEIGDSAFAVAPLAPLKPGEYGFVLRASLRAGGDLFRIYDFRVPG